MQASQGLSIDPNAKKNRVPGRNEIITLRNLAQQNERAMQDLDKQIEERKSTLISLQRRYEELLECAQSEIALTERSSATLAAQRSLIEADQEEIKGLLHPIRRCPSDVLQYLFEWAVEIDFDWFHCATRLSHVCRRWREVTILTPKLWVDIWVSSASKPEDVQAFWSRSVERIKFAPARITIDITGTTDKHRKALQNCSMDLLQNIDRLEFRLHSIDAPLFLTATPFRLPTCPVNHLELDAMAMSFPELIVDVTAISPQYVSPRSFAIYNISTLLFSQGLDYPTVTTIIIDTVDNVLLSSLGRAFPNVETASLADVTLDTPEAGELIWPNLKRLTVSFIDTSYDLPWRLLDATGITSLTFSGAIYKGAIAFIAAHRSLQTLEISDMRDRVYARIATIAPQIRKLTIIVFEGIVETIMKLNKLTHLSVCDNPSTKSLITLELFEKIVRSRCLPSRYGKSSLPRVSLEMLLDDSICKIDTEWHTSKLLETAHEEVTEVELWGSTFKAYCYTWE